MAERVWNSGWLSENSQRNYPLSEMATRWDVSGTVQIPNDLIVDGLLSVPYFSDLDVTLFHIQSINTFAQGVTIGIGYNNTAFATVTIDSTTFTVNSTYTFFGSGDFANINGKLTVGSLANLVRTPGALIFNTAGAMFETRVVVPQIRGITSLSVMNGTEISNQLDGALVLQSGSNIRLTMDEATKTIRIDALDTADLTQNCTCAETDLGNPILAINGTVPDESGNITLIGTDCLKITAGTNALILQDDCAQVCCSCSELSVINSAMQTLMNEVQTMNNTTIQLASVIQNLQTNILASKLN